jgi:hypothetical protein
MRVLSCLPKSAAVFLSFQVLYVTAEGAEGDDPDSTVLRAGEGGGGGYQGPLEFESTGEGRAGGGGGGGPPSPLTAPTPPLTGGHLPYEG